VGFTSSRVARSVGVPIFPSAVSQGVGDRLVLVKGCGYYRSFRVVQPSLEKIARSIFKHWFIDFEFPNADGKPYKSSGGAMVRSDLGDIPEGWQVGKLSDEFEIIMGQSPAGSSFNEEKQGMIFFQGRTDFGFRFPTVRLYTTEPKRIAEKFDVLVSVRAPVGDINVATVKCCIGRGLAAVRNSYKSYCLHKLKSYRKFFDVFESEGTVFGSLNKQNFNDLASIVPMDKVIRQFEDIVKTSDSKFYSNDLQIQTLTKTRDALLPKLMSGQLRVRE
jgi:type I restriction enzyme, S subunit